MILHIENSPGKPKGIGDPASIACTGKIFRASKSHFFAHQRGSPLFMVYIGIDTLKSELLTLLPYIPVEKVK